MRRTDLEMRALSLPRFARRAFGVAILTIGARTLRAQSRPTKHAQPLVDSTPARILAGGSVLVDVIVDVLRENGKPYSASKRQELADSIVARAISNSRTSNMALMAIALSGSSEPARGGTPDRAALGRLIRVHQLSSNPVIRILALDAMIDQIDPARALPYLRQVATSDDVTAAYYAVRQIARLGFGFNTSRAAPADRAAAQATLRDLDTNDLVNTPRAAEVLCELAKTERWPGRHECHPVP